MSTVHLVFGSQGAGKTTYARSLAERTQSTRFSIDDWMGELYGPDLVKPLNFPWIMARVQRCESLIWSTATDIVRRGGSVVLDLGFMKVNDRSRFVAKAEAKAISVQMHFVTAPHEVRRKRVLSRNATQGETFAFEVTAGMFDFMETQFEKPTAAELAKSHTFSSE